MILKKGDMQWCFKLPDAGVVKLTGAGGANHGVLHKIIQNRTVIDNKIASNSSKQVKLLTRMIKTITVSGLLLSPPCVKLCGRYQNSVQTCN